MNVLEAMECDKKHFNVVKQLKIKRVESVSQESLVSELREYEKQVLSSRLSDIQNYLALIKKKPTIQPIIHDSKGMPMTIKQRNVQPVLCECF